MEGDKYEILFNESSIHEGTEVYRIKALKDFRGITKGSLGGFVEDYYNLCQEGDSWIYPNAVVYGNASVMGDATVAGFSVVKGEALISDNSNVSGWAVIKGHARIRSYAEVTGKAVVKGNASVCGRAKIMGNATIKDNAYVSDIAVVRDEAVVCGDAEVRGNCSVSGNAVISGRMEVTQGNVQTDLSKSLVESIRAQTGLIPANGKVIAYKQIKKNYSSFYNSKFIYKKGIIEVHDYDPRTDISCASGLHFSNASFWNSNEDIMKSIFVIAEIDLEDIIAVQGGKIRCRRANIIDFYEIERT